MATFASGGYSGPLKIKNEYSNSNSRFVGTNSFTSSVASAGSGIFTSLQLPNLLSQSGLGTDSLGNLIAGSGGGFGVPTEYTTSATHSIAIPSTAKWMYFTIVGGGGSGGGPDTGFGGKGGGGGGSAAVVITQVYVASLAGTSTPLVIGAVAAGATSLGQNGNNGIATTLLGYSAGGGGRGLGASGGDPGSAGAAGVGTLVTNGVVGTVGGSGTGIGTGGAGGSLPALFPTLPSGSGNGGRGGYSTGVGFEAGADGGRGYASIAFS